MKYFLRFRNNVYGAYSNESLELEFNSKDWQGIMFDTKKGWVLKKENLNIDPKEDSSSLNQKFYRPFRNQGCPCQKNCCDNPQIVGGESEFESHCNNCGESCYCDE